MYAWWHNGAVQLEPENKAETDALCLLCANLKQGEPSTGGSAYPQGASEPQSPGPPSVEFMSVAEACATFSSRPQVNGLGIEQEDRAALVAGGH